MTDMDLKGTLTAPQVSSNSLFHLVPSLLTITFFLLTFQTPNVSIFILNFCLMTLLCLFHKKTKPSCSFYCSICTPTCICVPMCSAFSSVTMDEMGGGGHSWLRPTSPLEHWILSLSRILKGRCFSIPLLS